MKPLIFSIIILLYIQIASALITVFVLLGDPATMKAMFKCVLMEFGDLYVIQVGIVPRLTLSACNLDTLRQVRFL